MNSSVAKESGSFRKPSTNSDDRISAIQNEFIKVQSDIGNLTSVLGLGDALDVLKTRLGTLEGEFQAMKQQLADERREGSTADGKYDASITTLTNNFNSLDTQLKTMQASIEEESNRHLPTDIAKKIRRHQFSAAESLVLKMADNDNIPSIIQEVYANSEGNMDIILDFARALTKIDISYYVLRALRNEMLARGTRNLLRMVPLLEVLNEKVIFQDNCPAGIKAKAETMIDDIVADHESEFKEDVAAAGNKYSNIFN